MMPMTTAEGTRHSGSRNSVSHSGSGNGNGSTVPTWEGTTGRCSPKTDAVVSSTPTRSVHSLAAVAAQQTRSPIVTTHQPYRGVPLSVFDVESELQGYTGINSENLVTVKPTYKSNVFRTPGHNATGGLLPARSAQRSPIAAFDNNETQAGHIRGLYGGVAASAASPTSHGLTCCNGNAVSPGAAGVAPPRFASGRVTSGSKRMISLGLAERNGGCAGETYRCPIALHLVEKEERHLNYTAVELPSSEINTGDTAERSRRLYQRRRQVQYGKETLGYINYLLAVPNRCDREFRNPMHPITPRPEYDCSKRTFDRYLNTWRRQLHLWDEYDPQNREPQYIRIGIPTLRRLGLELPPSTPEGHQGTPLSFVPMAAPGSASACTPVTTRQARRDLVVSTAPYQRSVGYQQCSAAASNSTGGALPTSISVIPTTRPLSGCGAGVWSLANTPHTPYHGSMNSASSYPPPLVSVLEQPTFFSPHWADSSRQSSPNSHVCQRNSCYAYHSSGLPGSVTAGNVGASVSTSVPPNAQGNPAFGEGSGYFNNNNNNNIGYPFRGYGSPYGGHRHTPHSASNHYYSYYPANTGGGGASGNNSGNPMSAQHTYANQ